LTRIEEKAEANTGRGAECLPAAAPPSSALFHAFVHEFDKVAGFYARAPYPADWYGEEARALRYEPERRAQVAAILARQNREFGASPKTLANIERLRAGACAAVTGQQVGLFGGPLFSLLKALTAVRVAAAVTASGTGCVPVFWLATEDHDLAEIDHVVLPDQAGGLHALAAPRRHHDNAPVGDICFGAEIDGVVARLGEWLGPGDAVQAVQDCYRPGASYGQAFGRLLARWFRDFGVVLLDAEDPGLHRLAAPVYEAALRRAGELDEALLARGQALRRAGFHEQVKVTSSSTLLFALHDGARTAIHRSNGRFSIAREKLGEADVRARMQQAPEAFSANVLLRPVVQDYLLPTLAYIGGPAEVAYFAQAGVVYEALLGRVTPILPRLGVTIVEPRVKKLLARYGLAVSDAWVPAEKLRDRLAELSLPADLHANFAAAAARMEESLGAVSRSLEKLDRTLVDAAARAGAKMRYQLHHLRARAVHAELRRNDVLARHAGLMSAALYPHGALQERVIGGVYFLARCPGLLPSLYEMISPHCPDHQVVFV
jgi:bacillithiol biosynthesis cysteine-adding enzyme BshC